MVREARDPAGFSCGFGLFDVFGSTRLTNELNKPDNRINRSACFARLSCEWPP
jgi:hypothetical protein